MGQKGEAYDLIEKNPRLGRVRSSVELCICPSLVCMSVLGGYACVHSVAQPPKL